MSIRFHELSLQTTDQKKAKLHAPSTNKKLRSNKISIKVIAKAAITIGKTE